MINNHHSNVNNTYSYLIFAEEDEDKKRRVLWKALEFIPNSVALWKQAIGLEKEETAALLLKRAVEQVPECVEFWLALAKLQTYDEAKKTLNKVVSSTE